MIRLRYKPTKRTREGAAPAVPALVDGMPADLVQLRAKPAQKPLPGCFVSRSR